MEMDSSWLDQWWKFWPVCALILPIFAALWELRTQIKANRKALLEMFNLQERKNDARANIPVVIEILDDLADLQQAFVFRGRFIPGLERRCPDIQFKDSKAENQMSVAERAYQLRVIARRMLNNCRKVIFLMPKNVMPETVKACKAIRDTWTSKEPGKKHAYEIKINAIASILQDDCDRSEFPMAAQQQLSQSRQKIWDDDEKLCEAIARELEKFHTDLEACAEEEFPTFAWERLQQQ